MLERVEKYEIIGEIGHGGMATVYRARDTRLDRDVAIKILPDLDLVADIRRREFERMPLAPQRYEEGRFVAIDQNQHGLDAA